MNQFYEIVNAYFMDYLENPNCSISNWKKEKQEVLFKIIKEEYKNLQMKDKCKKIKRPSNAPKKPKSGYMFFLQDQQIILKNEKPEMKQTEILKEVGALWHTISEKNKNKYIQLAEKEKERYTYEMENYEFPKEYLDSMKEYKKLQKEKKIEEKRLYPNKPKQAKNAFLIFSQRERENIKLESPEFKGKEILVEIGVRWQKIKDTEEADEYKELAKEDKERYDKEYKLFLLEKANKMGEINEISEISEIEGEENKNEGENEIKKVKNRSVDTVKSTESDKKVIRGKSGKKKVDKEKEKQSNKSTENEKIEKDKLEKTIELDEIQVDNSELELVAETNITKDLIDYETIVREIISENEEGITKKGIKLELLKRNIELEKEQLNEIIEKIQNE